MREVAIVGIGQTPVDEHWEKSLRELAGEAILAAIADAECSNIEAIYIGNMMSGSLNHQDQLGPLIADWAGLRGVETFKIESACGSGAAAIRAGLMAVGSGALSCVIAMGVEKMSDTPIDETTSALASAADADWESSQGISFVALNALIMQRYMYEYHWSHGDFAPFSINAHHNALTNPKARLRMEINRAQYERADMICDPINLLDASPTGDGAAAVVLLPAEKLRGSKRPIITIAGSGSATDSITIPFRRDALWLSAAYRASQTAYTQAGVSAKDIDFFELHDAFSIMAALSLEACGFAERGQGPRLGLEGEICIGGRIPVATMGGLKARGHPVGATGVYQVVEAVQQLRGTAGPNQVENARIAMTQNIGGSGSNITTHILKRLN